MKYPSKPTTDPILPSNYLSWRQLVAAERLNMERTEAAIKTTLARIQAKQIELGFKNLIQFKIFYNNYSNSLITDKSVNYLLTIGTIEPIAHQIKLFVSNRVSQSRSGRKGGNIYLVYDFGILRSNYEYWKKNGIPRQSANRGRTKENFTPAGENARTKLDLPKTLAYQRFANTIKAANKQSRDKVTIPQMVLLAIEEYMQNRPELFGEPETQIASDSSIRIKDNKMLTAHISPDTMKKSSALLARYNSVNAIAITQSQLVEKAILQMIERSPVEYVDPELARELKRQEGESDERN